MLRRHLSRRYTLPIHSQAFGASSSIGQGGTSRCICMRERTGIMSRAKDSPGDETRLDATWHGVDGSMEGAFWSLSR
jgi:hypothetical protein